MKGAGMKKTIVINGSKVKIPVETFKRIMRLAKGRKIAPSAAIIFCLEKVI